MTNVRQLVETKPPSPREPHRQRTADVPVDFRVSQIPKARVTQRVATWIVAGELPG
ncbi:hypothetical protein ACIBCN_39055 [Nocardia sp. NPDC051052]|uniref:hypothetical protein n=1 Tax=Nocardia sp. NPDC051052 TaxID=3364322 RepID=UPI0037A50F7E